MNAKRRTPRGLRCLALILVLAMVCSTGVLARDEETTTHKIKVTVTNGTAYLIYGVKTTEGETKIDGTTAAVTKYIEAENGANVTIKFQPASADYVLDKLTGVPGTSSSGSTLGGGVGGGDLVGGDGTIGSGGTIGGDGTIGDGTTGDGSDTTGGGTIGGGSSDTTGGTIGGGSSDTTGGTIGGGSSDTTGGTIGGGSSDTTGGTTGGGATDETLTGGSTTGDGSETTSGSDPANSSLGGSDPANNGTTEENGNGDSGEETNDLMAAASAVTVDQAPDPYYTCNLTNVTKDQDINVAYALDSNGNGVPDQYEVTVTFKIVNGTWSDGKTGDITEENVPVRDWKDSGWIRTLGKVYVTAPTGMKPNDGYDQNRGSWDSSDMHMDDEVSNSYTFTYTFKLLQWTLNYEGADLTFNTVKVDRGSKIMLFAPTKSGYTLTGWKDQNGQLYAPGEVITPTQDLTLTAVWKEDTTETSGGSSGGDSSGGSSGDKTGGGSSSGSDKTSGGSSSGSDKTSGDKTGGSSGGNGGSGTISGSVGDDTSAASTVPELLNGTDHYAYIVGYEDGTVQPKGSITRAEIATIFFRLLKTDVREKYLTKENSFTDVSENSWYCTAISTLVNLGILEGRTKTIFDPNAVITRAELATICARFVTGTGSKEVSFSDIQGHWSQADVEKAASYGWIQGYDDGTFQPDKKITRAEAITIINRVLGRSPQGENSLLDGMNVWSDNTDQNAWYYLDIQEATNSHEFTRKDENQEAWVKLTDTPDWDQYEN